MNPDLTWGSGIGVLGVMHEADYVPVIPVVLVVDDPVRVRADLKAGWNCHLLREPISSGELCELVAEILQPAANCGRAIEMPFKEHSGKVGHVSDVPGMNA
jgi:hypothetical protein